MAIITLKPFQQQAVDSAVAVFDHMRSILDTAGLDEANRATAIHDNGYLLIEAPTGAGKTLMAGNIVEPRQCCRSRRLVLVRPLQRRRRPIRCLPPRTIPRLAPPHHDRRP